MEHCCRLVLGGSVDDGENRELFGVALRPHHVGLHELVECGGSGDRGRSNCIGALVPLTCGALILRRTVQLAPLVWVYSHNGLVV